MMKFTAILLICLATVYSVFSATFPVDDGVLVLDDSNIDAALEQHDQILVEFYAPWCGHCKSLAPEWAKAAKTLTAANSPIALAKVDATVAKEAAQKYQVQGFPTIKYFKKGKAAEYSGGRTESEIVSWVNKKSGPVYVTVSTVEELEALQEKHEVFVLGAYTGESAHHTGFINMANEVDDEVPLAITTSPAVLAKLGVSKDTVVVLKTFDEKRADYVPADATFDLAELRKFISGQSVPLIQEFSPESAKKIFKSTVQKHVLLFTDKDAAYHAATMEAVKPVAEAHRGDALVVNVPISEKRVYEFFGVKEDSLPAMYVADMSNPSGMKKYPYEGAFETAALTAFVSDCVAGKVKPTLKSEDPAPEDTAGPVVVLKGSSFADLVINNEKDVLVEFYAPWCGHCKNLAPIWDELGAKFASNENVVVAKMDATANEIDIEGVSVKGFPTIYFFKGNDKANPVKYEEGRELKDFVAYLKNNAHNKAHDEL